MARRDRRAYQREYRRKNLERRRAIERRSRLKNIVSRRVSSLRWALKNKAHLAAYRQSRPLLLKQWHLEWRRRERAALSEKYIRGLLSQSATIRRREWPQELVDTYREFIRLKKCLLFSP